MIQKSKILVRFHHDQSATLRCHSPPGLTYGSDQSTWPDDTVTAGVMRLLSCHHGLTILALLSWSYRLGLNI